MASIDYKVPSDKYTVTFKCTVQDSATAEKPAFSVVWRTEDKKTILLAIDFPANGNVSYTAGEAVPQCVAGGTLPSSCTKNVAIANGDIVTIGVKKSEVSLWIGDAYVGTMNVTGIVPGSAVINITSTPDGNVTEPQVAPVTPNYLLIIGVPVATLAIAGLVFFAMRKKKQAKAAKAAADAAAVSAAS